MRRSCCLCSLLACLFAVWVVPCAQAQSLIRPSKILSAALRQSTKDKQASAFEPRVATQRVYGSKATFSRIVSFRYPLAERQSLNLSTEFIRLTSFYVAMAGLEGEPDWKFKAIPITLSYEYTLSAPTRRFVPVVGAGAGVYLTKMSRLKHPAGGPMLVTDDRAVAFDNNYGVGYGVQATFGLHTNLSRHLFVTTTGRFRLVNGLAFLGARIHEVAEFPVFDFAVGFGVKL